MITMIVARADNGVIGRDDALPWHLPADLRRFKALTLAKPMIMGRRTFDSLPGLLPGRRHIVLTRDVSWSAIGAEVAHDIPSALALAGDEASVIGGAEIFALFAPIADRWEVTEVAGAPVGDTHMPAPDPMQWHEVVRAPHDGFAFVSYARR